MNDRADDKQRVIALRALAGALLGTGMHADGSDWQRLYGQLLKDANELERAASLSAERGEDAWSDIHVQREHTNPFKDRPAMGGEAKAVGAFAGTGDLNAPRVSPPDAPVQEEPYVRRRLREIALIAATKVDKEKLVADMSQVVREINELIDPRHWYSPQPPSPTTEQPGHPDAVAWRSRKPFDPVLNIGDRMADALDRERIQAKTYYDLWCADRIEAGKVAWKFTEETERANQAERSLADAKAELERVKAGSRGSTEDYIKLNERADKLQQQVDAAKKLISVARCVPDREQLLWEAIKRYDADTAEGGG